MQKFIQPPAYSDHGLHRILSSYWLVHFYLMKKSAKVHALFWFGLWDVRILYLQAVIQRTIDVSPAFWSTVRRKRLRFDHMQTVIQTSRRFD
jgi:hypothetical protein